VAVDGNLPLFLENVGKQYHARYYRRWIEALYVAGGVVDAGDWQVSASTPNGMSVDIAAGSIVVESLTGLDEGFYFIRNSAPILDVLLDPSDGTDDRIDLVVARILDSEHDGGAVNNDPDNPPYDVITGIPASSPVVPDLPNNAEPIAQIAVGSGSTTIIDANITDLRRLTPRARIQKQTLTWSAVSARPTRSHGI
jgi:hypothetical protein